MHVVFFCDRPLVAASLGDEPVQNTLATPATSETECPSNHTMTSLSGMSGKMHHHLVIVSTRMRKRDESGTSGTRSSRHRECGLVMGCETR